MGSRTRAIAPLLLAAAALAAPASAAADSLLYVKDGNVWIARPDGGHAHRLTGKANNWAWPSQAGDGTIVVAGGAQRINPDATTESSGGTELYRLSPRGHRRGAPLTTPGSVSSPACPAYGPQDVRVAPDGARIAYTAFVCGDLQTFWTPSDRSELHRTVTDYIDPSWLDGGRLLLTHDGPTIDDGQAAFGIYTLATGDAAGWSTQASPLPRYHVVAAPAGDRLAIVEDDAPDYVDATPRQAGIRLLTSTGPGTPPVQRCRLAIPAGSFSRPALASPSFSPDGTRLAWGEDDGVHIAELGDLSDCGTIREHLAVPGGSYPFLGPHDPASVRVRARIHAPRHVRAGHRVKLRARKVRGGHYRWSFGDGRHGHGRKVAHRFRHPGHYRVRLTVRVDGTGKARASRRIAVRR